MSGRSVAVGLLLAAAPCFAAFGADAHALRSKRTPSTTRVAAPPTTAPVGSSAKVFGPGVVHEVAFTVPPEYLPGLTTTALGRVPSTMSFDGITLERSGLSLKRGGATTRDLDGKASFSVKTDAFVDGQELYGLDRFTLGSSVQDHSFVAEQVAYDVFRAAGIPAPRTALAKVTFNGEPFGLYVLREVYDKDFLRRNFADPDGNLYETIVGIDMSDPRMEPRTNEEANDKSDIAALAQVVDAVPDEQYVDAVGKLVDLKQVFNYWAAEAIVAHFDGYLAGTDVPLGNSDPAVVTVNSRTNNYYTYHDPRTGKFVVLPYGADKALGNPGDDPLTRLDSRSFSTDPQFLDEQDLGGARFPTLSTPKPTARTIARLERLPGTEERLRRALLRVLDRAWDRGALLARADQIAALVRASGPPETREEWTPEAFEQAFARRRSFIEHRAAEVRAELGVPANG